MSVSGPNDDAFRYLAALYDDPDLQPRPLVSVPPAAPAVEAIVLARGRCRGEHQAPVDVDETWREHANCLGCDPELFFPERGESTVEAKAVCRSCVVRLECLEFALSIGEKIGIWGGLSERERRRLRRARAQRIVKAAESA